MKDIQSSRKEINQIDLQMAELFEKRMEICKDIALYKKDNGLSIRDEAREAEVVKRNAEYIQNTEIQPYYEDFIRNTMDVSCKYQSSLLRSMRVAYCGIQGAFAYIASKRMFPEAEYVACATFAEAYEGVEKGEFDCAVLPLENSYAGEVGEVMDLTFNGSLHINQVIEVPITHNLIACEGATLDTIKTVVSHPQALAQCADYLKEKVSRASLIPTPRLPPSTSRTLATSLSEPLRPTRRQKFSGFKSSKRASTTQTTTRRDLHRFQGKSTSLQAFQSVRMRILSSYSPCKTNRVRLQARSTS